MNAAVLMVHRVGIVVNLGLDFINRNLYFEYARFHGGQTTLCWQISNDSQGLMFISASLSVALPHTPSGPSNRIAIAAFPAVHSPAGSALFCC
jgi:hypothetical protein